MKKLLLLILWVTIGHAAFGQGNVMVVNPTARPVPVTITSGSTGATTVASTALEASHVLKASAGNLVSLIVTDTTAEYILVMNSATVPADGAVTLLVPPIKVAANTTTMITFPSPFTASTGISVSNSSTGTFTKTIGGNTCIYAAQVQ